MKTNIKQEKKVVELSKLVPYDKNPNIHPEEQVKALAESMDEYGQYYPIIVDEDGLSQACWIPYDDQTRKVLSEAFVANRKNGAERRTYEEILTKRVFDSYIVKEENMYDRYINSYALNIDALYESERIKTEMFDYEQSLWEY